MKKVNLIILIILILNLAFGAAAVYADSKFSDVKESSWYYSYVTNLVEKGGINGYPDGTFKSGNTITAAEFVKITVSLIDGKKEATGSHWASGYFQAATVLEIVPEGMFEEKDWNKPITRQKMGVIMEKTAEIMYGEKVETDTAKLEKIKTSITDYASICDYCKDYIVQAVNRGLITGYTDGTFKPTNTATRAEASTMLTRLIEPAYRVFTPETAPDPGVVSTGTNLSDYIKIQEQVDLLHGIDINKYSVLKDGSKFSLKYLFSSDEYFFVEYKCYGNVFTLDKNGNYISYSAPGNSPTTLVKQGFKGELNDTAYFVFVDGEDDTAYIIPNTLTE